VRKPWKATVRDALGRTDGPFWGNVKASPDWAAYEALIGQIMGRAAQVDEWGEPCPDYEPGCPVCEAWKTYNAKEGQQ
jgi:hypothetical protein